jgi:DNA-binding FadR family transcriptional regulator
MLLFYPARSRRAFEDVVMQVERAILDGQLKPGDRLPSERELTKQLTVSRGTLREAFRILEYSGLITIKKGTTGGAFVSRSSSAMVANSLKWLLRMKRISLEDLAAFRERLEGGAACDAARKATRKHLERLEDIVTELEKVASRKELWPRVVELDLQFHEQVAEASGNVLNCTVMSSIIECMREAFEAIPSDQGERVLRDHRHLFRLIRSGDAEAAEALMRRHIGYFTRLILANTRGVGR